MLTIEQLDQLKQSNDLRAQFQAVTGLTWDPTTITDQEFLDKIQWYFPKGAGFDKKHIAFDKELIINLGGIRGVDSEPYYNEEKKIDVSDEATLSMYNIKPEDAKAADKDGNGVVKIVSKSVQDEEGKYLTDSEENYTKVYEVEDDSNA